MGKNLKLRIAQQNSFGERILMYFEKFIHCGSSKLCLQKIITTTTVVFINLFMPNTQ